MSTFDDAKTDAEDLARLVNENTLVTTRYGGQQKKSWLYIQGEIESEIDEAIFSMESSRGFRVVGDFASGFTYELANDVAIDSNGNYWGYADVSALPVTVTAGAVPSEPEYSQRTWNSASAVIADDGSTVQYFIDLTQDYIDNGVYEFNTVEDYKNSSIVFPVGKSVYLRDRKSKFIVVSGTSSANGFNIIGNVTTSQSLELIDDGVTILISLGLSSDNTDIENGAVIDYINTSYSSNRQLYLPNGLYNSNKGLKPSSAFRLEGESQLGAILNITDSTEDCFTWLNTSGIIKHLTLSGGKNGHVLGDGLGVSTAGRELLMEDILFLNNSQSGRVFNMGWACSYSKIKIFNPATHADHWRAVGFTNNIMTRGSLRVTGMGDPVTIRIDGSTLRQCGYDGEIILEGNTNSSSVAMKSFGGSLDGFIAKGLYGETHTLGYIDFSASACHDVEITCNLIGYEGAEGSTVYGIKDAAGLHIHDSNFTGDIMSPITSASACLILNCYARTKGGSYSKNLIYDPYDSDKVKITNSVVFNLSDKMSSALSLPGYFQGEIPDLSEGSQHIFGSRSIGYLPDGNDLDHIMYFRKFGVDKFAMETVPLKIIVSHNGSDYTVPYAPAGTTVVYNAVGNISVKLPAGTLGNAQATRFSDIQFVNRRLSGRRSITPTTFVENTDDDTIDIQLYDSTGSAVDLVVFEQLHVDTSFVKSS